MDEKQVLELKDKYDKVRLALERIVGADTKEDLEALRDTARDTALVMPGDAETKSIALFCIDALLDTLEE